MSIPETSDQIDQITVVYTDQDREMAPKVVNQLVENYLRETRRRLDEELLMSKAFFEKEVDRYRAMVQELENKEVQFRVNHAGLMPDDPSSVQNKLVELRASLTRVTEEIGRRQRRSTPSSKSGSRHSPTRSRRSRRSRIRCVAQLIAMQTELEKDLDKQTPRPRPHRGAPAGDQDQASGLADLSKQIAQTQGQVDGPSSTEPNAAKTDAQRQLETMTGTITALTRQRDETSDQIEKFEMLDRNFVVIRAEFSKLERDLADATSLLKVWEENLNRMTSALNAELGARGVTLSFTQRAEIAKPKSPTFAGVVGVAVVLGLGVGAGILLLAELTDHSFRTVNQAIDELKLPVLGAVTEIITPVTNAVRGARSTTGR